MVRHLGTKTRRANNKNHIKGPKKQTPEFPDKELYEKDINPEDDVIIDKKGDIHKQLDEGWTKNNLIGGGSSKV